MWSYLNKYGIYGIFFGTLVLINFLVFFIKNNHKGFSFFVSSNEPLNNSDNEAFPNQETPTFSTPSSQPTKKDNKKKRCISHPPRQILPDTSSRPLNKTHGGLDLAKFSKHPAIYRLFHKLSQRNYYGETESPLGRASQHFKDLAKGSHSQKALQEAWNLTPGVENFEFYIIEQGPHLTDPLYRKSRQNLYIAKSPLPTFNT
nr:hypothetical protein [Chloromonas rosae]